LANDLALVGEPFSRPTVSFADSLGSDHAIIHTSWALPTSLTPLLHSHQPASFVIDDELQASWSVAFGRLPSLPIFDPESTLAAASCLISDIIDTSASLFP
jgi:hypothetical protein